MKKNLFYLFALICTMSLFTACSDDDDPVYPIEEEIAGTYKGTLDIELAGASVAKDLPKNVTITKVSGNVVSLELKDFSFMGSNIGTIKLEKCILKQNGSSYTFTGNQELNLTGIGKCSVKLAGTFNNGKTEVNLDIDVLQLEQKVKVIYKGNRLTGSESSEAKITAFAIDSDWVTEQPQINEAAGTITFKVSDAATADDLKALKPEFTISDKATVSPASGVVQDFSANKAVTYTVVAENGATAIYTVSIAGSQNVLKYSFEEWEPYGQTGAELPLPREELATSSEGAALLVGYGKGVPVYKSEDKIAGDYAIRLVTMDLSEHANALIPAITSGSVFTGKFDMMAAFTDRLACTRFGIAYDKKPLRFKGWYKYTPGEKFVDGSDYNNIKEVADKVDECAIQAVLYEAVDEAGNEVTLTGHDIGNSKYRVAVAVVADGTAKAEYTEFDLPFVYLENKTYDANKTYKMAIVCSSSKEGDLFKGAGGSTLFVDEIEVIGEPVAANN